MQLFFGDSGAIGGFRLPHRHRPVLGLLLMVIRFVAHGDFFLSHLPKPLPDDLASARDRRSRSQILKAAAHRVKQPGDRQHDRGGFQVVPAIQKELSELVALGGGL